MGREVTMRVALVQQHATHDRTGNLRRGLLALAEAARRGAELVCFAELAFERFHPQRPAAGDVRHLAEVGSSHARHLLPPDRRPDLYPAWLGR